MLMTELSSWSIGGIYEKLVRRRSKKMEDAGKKVSKGPSVNNIQNCQHNFLSPTRITNIFAALGAKNKVTIKCAK